MALATQLEPGEELEDAPVSSGFRCACTSGHVAPVLLSITAKEGADQMKKSAAQGGYRRWPRPGRSTGGAEPTGGVAGSRPTVVREGLRRP
mmetsp:Transcript_27323/g.69190  ORF Transcript_27323/g.69190 Transcript_27323/m.69190 type:complete len:91 (+) Transcript_27323:287-559(+)